jgi:hypothetical protein
VLIDKKTSRVDFSTRLSVATLCERRNYSAALTKRRYKKLAFELQRRALRHFVRAWLVRRGIGFAIDGLNQAFGKHVDFDFLAADVGQHVAIDLNARAEHLAAFLDHFLALDGVVDDVAIFEGQVVFAHDGAHALAPAARRFQVSNDFRFIHKIRFDNRVP